MYKISVIKFIEKTMKTCKVELTAGGRTLAKVQRSIFQGDTMLVMKSGKLHLDGKELPNQDKIRLLGEKETYKYFGILEADTIK